MGKKSKARLFVKETLLRLVCVHGKWSDKMLGFKCKVRWKA
jgi:hypothetical protein